MSPELIKKIKDSPTFSELQDYIVGKILELNSLDGLDKMSNEQAGEEAKVRAKAGQKLNEILSPFIEFSEKKEPSEKEVAAAHKKFAL